MTSTLPTNHFIQEPAEVYHAKAADYLGSHRLADFRRCPLLYHWKQTGLCKDEDRPAYQLGRAAHTLILEARQTFLAQYAIGGPGAVLIRGWSKMSGWRLFFTGITRLCGNSG